MAEKRTTHDEEDKDYKDMTPITKADKKEDPEAERSSSEEDMDEGANSGNMFEIYINWFMSWIEKKASTYILQSPSPIKEIKYCVISTDTPEVVDEDTIGHLREHIFMANPQTIPANCVFRKKNEMGIIVTFESGYYLRMPIAQSSSMFVTPYLPKHLTRIDGNDPYTLRNYDVDIIEAFGYSREELASKPVHTIRVSQLDNNYELGLCVRFVDADGKYITYKPSFLDSPHPEYSPGLYILNEVDEPFVFASVSVHSIGGAMIKSIGYDIGQIEDD